jgi:hypothetical protein
VVGHQRPVDVGLMLGAITLGRLAAVYDPPLRLFRR